MAIAEISVVPLGLPHTSLSGYVARALKILQGSGLSYELTGMGTIIHGDLDEIWPVLKQMHESCFSGESFRVLTQIRIDDRRDKDSTPEAKVQAVRNKLAQS